MEPVPAEQAGLELVRRYFTHFGPATIHDAMYFFRVPAARVKGWLDRLPVRSADCGGRTFYWIESGDRKEAPVPACLFLAGFDQLLLGYEKKESLYLRQEHLRSVFSLSGIVSPVLLLNGQASGRWRLKNRKLMFELFHPVSAGDRKTVRETAEALWPELDSFSFPD